MAGPVIRADAFDPRAVRVAAQLQEAGFQAVFAGGCVRDALLGRVAQDVDIATDAHPDQVLRVFPGAKFIGKSFGVTLAPGGDRLFEVATFRRDVGIGDGRHPESVVFSRAEEDAHRRDFTINGLFFDPVTGQVLDYVGGLRDLADRVLRAIGAPDDRFAEDHLRMLRAIRFAAVLGFDLEAGTAAAIRRAAPQILRISAERILQELTRAWTEAPRPGVTLRLLQSVGLLNPLLPEVEAMRGVAQPPAYHPEGDVFVHTALALDQLRAPDPALAWAVLLHDVGKPPSYRVEPAADGPRIRFEGHARVGAEIADRILRRLRASNELRESVVHAVRGHMRFVDWPQMRKATRRRMVAHPLFPLELELHRADCCASHGQLDTYAAAREELERYLREPKLPAPWLDGHDLMALGIPEGPAVGQWRRRVYDLQLEGSFSNREALREWVRRQIAEGPQPDSPPPPDPSADSSA